MFVQRSDQMIGIIAAMRAEVDALLELMDQKQEVEQDGVLFWEGILSQHSVVLMLSGVGKGNAAMTTTLMMKNYHPEYVINIGTAGGLTEAEEVLDLVISEGVVQHDYDTRALDGEAGIGLYFSADARLTSLCEQICKKQGERYHVGLVASGDQFIAEETQLTTLLAQFPSAMCAEMEAGAVAQVCTKFQTPFVILRSLSDIAFKEKSELDFNEYVHLASKRSAKYCALIVNAAS